MVSVEQFLDDLRAAPKPVGVGLITLHANATNGHQVICVDNPSFVPPLPVDFDYPIKQILAAPLEILEVVVEAKHALPILEAPLWWSFAIYE